MRSGVSPPRFFSRGLTPKNRGADAAPLGCLIAGRARYKPIRLRDTSIVSINDSYGLLSTFQSCSMRAAIAGSWAFSSARWNGKKSLREKYASVHSAKYSL